MFACHICLQIQWISDEKWRTFRSQITIIIHKPMQIRWCQCTISQISTKTFRPRSFPNSSKISVSHWLTEKDKVDDNGSRQTDSLFYKLAPLKASTRGDNTTSVHIWCALGVLFFVKQKHFNRWEAIWGSHNVGYPRCQISVFLY